MYRPRVSLARARVTAAVLLAAGLTAACGSGEEETPTGPDTPPPSINAASLPSATVGESYTESITVSGGDGAYFWDVIEGELPPGLTGHVDDLTLDEFLITGDPASEGSFSFRVRVEDGTGRADTAGFQITVAPPPGPVSVLTERLPPALTNAIYRVILDAAGGDGVFTWSVVEGTLPDGLSLGSDGQFQGEPTGADTTTFTVEVTSNGDTATQQLTLPVVQEDPDRFDITSFPVVPIPPELRDNVREAIERWEAAITGDLSAIAIPTGDAGFGPDGCFGFGEMANGTSVDDLLILVNIDSIDGPFDILGQASPCAVRNSNDLPFIGALTLDEDDLARFSEETTTDIIQHEIGHILGFGTLWNFGDFNLLIGAGGSDPRYVGAEAVAEYQEATGATDSIPVEDEGGEGTRDSHWRESIFDDELLTGFSEADGVPMFLSRMSIASFADLGFQVDLTAAEDGTLVGLLRHPAGEADHDTGYDRAGAEPILVLEHGQLRPPNRPQ